MSREQAESLAATVYQLYTAFKGAGFTEMDAFRLTLAFLEGSAPTIAQAQALGLAGDGGQ